MSTHKTSHQNKRVAAKRSPKETSVPPAYIPPTINNARIMPFCSTVVPGKTTDDRDFLKIKIQHDREKPTDIVLQTPALQTFGVISSVYGRASDSVLLLIDTNVASDKVFLDKIQSLISNTRENLLFCNECNALMEDDESTNDVVQTLNNNTLYDKGDGTFRFYITLSRFAKFGEDKAGKIQFFNRNTFEEKLSSGSKFIVSAKIKVDGIYFSKTTCRFNFYLKEMILHETIYESITNTSETIF